MATIIHKLLVEVIDARNLLPKDGHGTASPYVILDFHGQRKKTNTIIQDLNPTWCETLEFNVGKASQVLGDMLELDVLHDRNVGPTTRNNFLGRVRLNSKQFVKKGEEALIYYPLEKKNLLSWIQGEIGLKIYFFDEVVPAKVAEKTEMHPIPVENPSEENPLLIGPAASPADTQKNVDAPHVEPEAPSGGLMVQSVASSGTMPEIKLNNVSRVSSVSSFVSDHHSDQLTIEKSSFDLVEKMYYLFVRVVKARSLPTMGSPVVKIAVSSSHIMSKPARRTTFFYYWDQTFAFHRESPDSSTVLEVSVWDPTSGNNFLGGICFDVSEILLRDPPDSPLAPQWYRLEGGGPHRGDLMLASWIGTQADESFPDAWKTDTAGNPSSRSKVYQSPKLWYLRATILEAHDLNMSTLSKDSSFQVKVQFGFQVQKTKSIVMSTGSPAWNEDLLFVAAEPFTEYNLIFFLLGNRLPKERAILGVVSVPLTSIERRVDDHNLASRWFTLEDPNVEKKAYKGRVHLRLCFDGGYHVMDEGAHMCSDYRPTARQLWKPPIGVVELGIVGCKSLLPMKTTKGKGSTDSYAVAKYGDKWVRTRTISDSFNPKWNEQYTWKVYDPSTVLTIAVFDSWELHELGGLNEPGRPDIRIGKVRIRLSTLATDKVYASVFPLLMLSPTGSKKMGEIELAIRFERTTPALDFLHTYAQPLFPTMHHVKPIGMVQQEALRGVAVEIISAHMLRSEPPLRREVVTYMLDSDSNTFSMRKVRANWFRIINVIADVINVFKWIEDTRTWQNPTSTVLVHALLVMLVWFPDLIISTFAFYMFATGAWNYRFRSRTKLPHFDPKVSLIESVDFDELDEEFDVMPSTRPNETVHLRYDKLRMLGARIQTVLGDVAIQGERAQALITWQDPRATGIFVGMCFIVALVWYLVPSKMVTMAFGFYYLRHPIFRDRMPSPALNFFRRLPSLSDRIL